MEDCIILKGNIKKINTLCFQYVIETCEFLNTNKILLIDREHTLYNGISRLTEINVQSFVYSNTKCKFPN